MSTTQTEVKLLMDYLNGKPLFENVPALQLGANRFKLTASPGFALGAAAGDEIELTTSEPAGFRVVRRSGNLCVQMLLRTCDNDVRSRISAAVKSIGGWLDGGYDAPPAGFLLVFTIPITTGFDVIADTMDAVAAMFDVDRWLYGNVYDTKDGVTPLNWWLPTDDKDGQS